MQNENFDILITSDEPWGKVWQLQLVYAYELSKAHNVFYCNPPKAWTPLNLFRAAPEPEKYNDRLVIFQYINLFPVRIMNTFFTFLNDCYNCYRLKKIIGPVNHPVLAWKFDTYRFRRFYGIPVQHTIYHVVDHYLRKKIDGWMASNADLVVCTSPKYEDHYLKFNSNVLTIPHGINLSDHIPDPEKAKEIKMEFGPFVLCLGTISDDIDLTLIEKSSVAIKNHLMLLIGPDKTSSIRQKAYFEKICSLPNVKYLGIRHGLEIKNYVASAVCGIVPYHNVSQTKQSNRSPMRILNYLAQKKITITSIDSEIPELKDKAIYHASSQEEFAQLVQMAVNNQLQLDENAVRSFLDKMDIQKLVIRILYRATVIH